MKIISFLGFGEYKETTYVHPNGIDKCTTKFFQEALVQFYKPEIIYVLLTKTVETQVPRGATETNWAALQKCLEGKPTKLQAIANIPERNSPEDVWEIFQQVTNHIEKNDTVIFDITYSFRSIPVVALISVSYLRVVHQVDIQGLLYGAFEAKNKETNETPTFDLLPIVSLLEWTTATDQFLKTGNGQSLANLLASKDPATQKLAANIDAIARGLQLLRPTDVMHESAMLPAYIASASPNISKTIPPFSSLLHRVEQDYGKFGLENSTDRPKESLVKQLQMIEWYAEKGQTVQALSLAREWLPSLLCFHFDLDRMDKQNRAKMERLLSGGIEKSNGRVVRKSSYLEDWEQIPEQKRKPLSRLWGGGINLANLRNDVLHSGFRKNAKSAKEIVEQTEQIIQELKLIAKAWRIED